MTGAATDEVLDDDASMDRAVRLAGSPSGGDRVFRLVATAAAMISLLVVVLTVVFLADQARPAFRHSGIIGFFTTSTWLANKGKFGVLGLLENTALIATVALCIGVPSSLSMAIFINEYAPRQVRQVMTSAIDLLAALPSLLFGIWGFVALETPEAHLAKWLSHHLSVLPFFGLSAQQVQAGTFARSTFAAGLVVGIMIIPVITSVSRDVMAQVPREQCEGALALGGTRWGMVRDVVLPFGRSGIVGGIILGLGRALGETIAVLYIVNQVIRVNTHILAPGSGSVASLIANLFDAASPMGRSGLIAAGLSLFMLTFVVNMIARVIVARSGRFS